MVTPEKLDHGEVDGLGGGQAHDGAAPDTWVTMEEAGATVAGRGTGEQGGDLVRGCGSTTENDFLHQRCINHA